MGWSSKYVGCRYNVPVFLRAWKKVLEDQRFRSYDWTVKVDMATRSRWKFRKIPPTEDTTGKMGPKGRFSPTVLFLRIFFLWCGWVERGSLGYVGKISDLFSKKIGNHLEIQKRPKWWDCEREKNTKGKFFWLFFGRCFAPKNGILEVMFLEYWAAVGKLI